MTLWSIRTPALASARSTSSTSGLWCSGACAFDGAGCGRLWAACRAVIGVSRAAKATIEAIRRRLRLDMASHSFMWSRRGRRWAASKSPEGRLPLTGLARHPWNAFLPYLRRALAEGYGRVFLPCQEVVCDGRRGDNRCIEQAAKGGPVSCCESRPAGDRSRRQTAPAPEARMPVRYPPSMGRGHTPAAAGERGSVLFESRRFRLRLEACSQEPLGERRQAPVGHLADARLAVARALGRLGRAAAKTVAQPEHRPAAVRQLTQQGVEIGAQVGALLLRCLGLGQELEDGAVHQVPETAAVLAPVDDAAVRQRRQQPGFRVADAACLRDHDQEGLLQQVVGILQRDAMAPQDPLELGLDAVEDLFERRLLHWGYLVAHA